MTWLRLTAVLTGMELRRLFRSQEVYRYCLIPATFGMSVVMAVSVLIASALVDPTRTVAVPLDLPDELPLEEALRFKEFEVVRAADPEALLDAGEVDAAISGWTDGDGIDAARDVGYATPWRWLVTGRARERRDHRLLERAAEYAADWAMEERVAIAGGDPDEVLAPATIKLVEVDEEPVRSTGVRTAAYNRAFPLFILISLAFFLHATGGLGDRNSGVTESLLTTPADTTSVLLARVLSTMVIQVVAIGLILGNMTVFLGMWVFAEDAAAGFEAVLTAGSTLFLADALLLAATLFAPTVKAAMNWGGFALGGLILAMFPGIMAEVPGWIPVCGGLHATGGWAWLVAGEHLLLGAGTLLLAARLLDRFPSYKAGGEEQPG